MEKNLLHCYGGNSLRFRNPMKGNAMFGDLRNIYMDLD
jgi:hypothetical protein